MDDEHEGEKMRWRGWYWLPSAVVLGVALLLLIAPGRNENVGLSLLLLAVILGTLGIDQKSE